MGWPKGKPRKVMEEKEPNGEILETLGDVFSDGDEKIGTSNDDDIYEKDLMEGKCTWCNRSMKVKDSIARNYCSESCKSMHEARL